MPIHGERQGRTAVPIHAPALISLSLPFEVIGVVILVVRLWPGLALGHMMFVGVMSNSLFAQVRHATPGAKPAAVRVIFYLMNFGRAVFILGLLADTAILKQIGTPIMGVGILHGIVLFTMACSGSRVSLPRLPRSERRVKGSDSGKEAKRATGPGFGV